MAGVVAVAWADAGSGDSASTQVRCANANENRPDSGTASSTVCPGSNRPVRQHSSKAMKIEAAPVFPRVSRFENHRAVSMSAPAAANRSKTMSRKAFVE